MSSPTSTNELRDSVKPSRRDSVILSANHPEKPSEKPSVIRSASRSVIELRGASRRFATPHGEFAALAEVDLTIDSGALVAVTGASGSGKSTLLNLIAGIDRPTGGRVRVAGTDVGALGESALSAWRGKTVGVVFQFFQLLPTLTALENVLLPMELCKTAAPKQARARARQLLERVGLGDQLDKLPAALSGGQQQRAAIARALANDPPVLLADEPTGNLDSRNGAAVLALLGELAAAGTTVVTVTHAREVARRADRVIELVDGRVASDVVRGADEEVRRG